ncbi:50S ribosomal protein L30 [Bacteroidia bacterium]|nr:50S ribosomal protein L30 [Bacteroidia bacterium]GHT17277.1 50S ribosomal protein L30 [Bacteroidia bacterium]
MGNVKITQVRSHNNSTDKQKATLRALNLGKINRSAECPLTSVTKGQIAAVSHLVKVETL